MVSVNIHKIPFDLLFSTVIYRFAQGNHARMGGYTALKIARNENFVAERESLQ